EAGLLERVVLADRLDRLTATTGTRVGDDDPVLGLADLAEPLQLDLDGHGWWYSSGSRCSGSSTSDRVGTRSLRSGFRTPRHSERDRQWRTAVHSARRGRGDTNRPLPETGIRWARERDSPGSQCQMPRDIRRMPTAGTKLLIWWATMLAGRRPVTSR